MNATLRTAFAVAGLAVATQAVAQVTFYEDEGFQGRSFTTQKQVGNFERYGFNDRASSVVVARDRWEVCDDARFGGRCVVLRPGRYASLAAMGLNDRVSSVRAVSRNARVDDGRYAPARGRRLRFAPAQPRAPVRGERHVGAGRHGIARAAMLGRARAGGAGARRPQCSGGGRRGSDRRDSRPPGRGRARQRHRDGRRRGRWRGDGRSHGPRRRRTADVHAGCPALRKRGQTGRPEYWDVAYTFRGEQHRMQMTTAPGSTITVNAQGEPRA